MNGHWFLTTLRRKMINQEERTADSIISFFKEAVASKKDFPPERWMEAAISLNVLRLDEAAKLNEMRRKIAERKVGILDKMEKRNVSEADLRIEATEEYRDFRDQQSKCEVIEEFVLLSKKYASSNNY